MDSNKRALIIGIDEYQRMYIYQHRHNNKHLLVLQIIFSMIQ